MAGLASPGGTWVDVGDGAPVRVPGGRGHRLEERVRIVWPGAWARFQALRPTARRDELGEVGTTWVRVLVDGDPREVAALCAPGFVDHVGAAPPRLGPRTGRLQLTEVAAFPDDRGEYVTVRWAGTWSEGAAPIGLAGLELLAIDPEGLVAARWAGEHARPAPPG